MMSLLSDFSTSRAVTLLLDTYYHALINANIMHDTDTVSDTPDYHGGGGSVYGGGKY